MAQKRAERLQIMLTLEEVKKVEEWRFENRMPSRSAAVRALMNLGLNSDVVLDRPALSEGAISSSDVGILENESVETLAPEASQDRPDVLVVEKDFLVSRGMKDLLDAGGINVIGPVPGWKEARPHLNSADLAAAVIGEPDSNDELRQIVERLSARGVPFLFCLAREPKACLPRSLWSAPVVSRTSARETLVAAIRKLLR